MNLAHVLGLSLVVLGSPNTSREATLGAMQAELERSARDLRLPNRPPPYFVSYWVVDYDQHDVEATLGTVVASNRDRGRRVRVELRVGDRTFDNSNFLGEGGFFAELFAQAGLQSPRPAPFEDPFALRRILWLATDAAYKGGVETLEKKHAARQSEVSREDEARSFSEAVELELLVDELPVLREGGPYEQVARDVSAVFRSYPDIQTSAVHVTASTETRFFVSTEGSRVVVPTPYTEISITCRTQAEDGMALDRSTSLAALSTEAPDATRATKEAHRIAKELVSLRNASVITDYSGPVLFEGRAAAQLVNELFSDSLSGTPPPKGGEGLASPLDHKIGKRILPDSFSIIDDPTLTEAAGEPLLGHYLVDDEGIPPERTVLVERGRLRAFLMSRAPRRDATGSSGHGRSGLVGWARGKPGNLIVSTQRGISRQDLRQRLLKLIREEGQDYGLIVSELEPRAAGSNGQIMPEPHLVSRLTRAGKEELVRGATIASMSLRDLKNIVAAGRERTVYSYAAPSGGGFALPTSVVAPSLLLEDVEVKRRPEPSKRQPRVPKPSLTTKSK